MNAYSPLRYPGGKGQVYDTVVAILEDNHLSNCTYIEPFAGGAGIAIRLLFENKVKRVIINDIDKSIYSVWYAILYNTDEFIKMIEETPITINEWYKQKDIQNKKDSVSILELGFSTFFLNRTNRSGIIKAGVIGGKSQNGNYKINCRFNKEKLIELIRKIAKYKNKIKIYNDDAKKLMSRYRNKEKQLFFIDPPYFEKGKNLYTNFFNEKDHEILSLFIKKNLYNQRLLISYDNCPQIEKLYKGFKSEIFLLNYSVQNKKKGEEIFFKKNLI
ncbi:MAG: DNA adenine methylase [Bacilli bacterium]|nr:DNA adenine methylase [Bacilli bacterium]